MRIELDLNKIKPTIGLVSDIADMYRKTLKEYEIDNEYQIVFTSGKIVINISDDNDADTIGACLTEARRRAENIIDDNFIRDFLLNKFDE